MSIQIIATNTIEKIMQKVNTSNDCILDNQQQIDQLQKQIEQLKHQQDFLHAMVNSNKQHISILSSFKSALDKGTISLRSRKNFKFMNVSLTKNRCTHRLIMTTIDEKPFRFHQYSPKENMFIFEHDSTEFALDYAYSRQSYSVCLYKQHNRSHQRWIAEGDLTSGFRFKTKTSNEEEFVYLVAGDIEPKCVAESKMTDEDREFAVWGISFNK